MYVDQKYDFYSPLLLPYVQSRRGSYFAITGSFFLIVDFWATDSCFPANIQLPVQELIMAEENSWKSREDDEDDELDETVRTIDIYPPYSSSSYRFTKRSKMQSYLLLKSAHQCSPCLSRPRIRRNQTQIPQHQQL